MQVELKVNDKSVQAEIPEEQLKETVLFEQLKKLGLIEDKPRTGYERVDEDDSYFVDDTINDGHEVIGGGGTLVNDLYYNNGNYYNDETIVENNARADKLFRCLRRWQAANDKAISISDWKNENIFKYHIEYDCFNDFPFVVYTTRFRTPNTIYFTSGEKAEGAIEVFKDELKWYYTKYQQRLDEE